MKNYKLDIFNLLSKIDNAKFDFIDSLSDDEIKAFAPYVVQQWLYGSYDNKELKTVLLNEYSNSFIFSLQKHPKLLYKLFCVSSGFGENKHYYPKQITTNKKPLTTKLLMKHYEISSKESSDMIPLYSIDEIIKVAEYNGMDETEIKKLKKEWS